MTNRNANKSSPGQPASQVPAGDAATQPQQSPRGYDTPSFASQEHPSPPQQRAQEQRRRPEDGAPGATALPAERATPWGEPRPRRRQDREAGPSDKQVYVPPVTLPPNREHQAMDLQKIQVAPSLLKGVDERNRPTMRRIPVPGLRGAPEEQGGARPGGVRTARVGVGSGVWPPPEDDLSGMRGHSSRKQRSQAAAAPQADAAPRAALSNGAARPEPAAVTAAAAAVALAARRRRAPLGLFALLVFLGSATVAGFWVLWRAASSTSGQDTAPTAEEGRAPAPEPGAAMPAPNARPEPPPPMAPLPVPVASGEPSLPAAPPHGSGAPEAPVAEPHGSAAPEAPAASAVANASPSSASSRAGSAIARPSQARPAVPVRRPKPPATSSDDLYDMIESAPSTPRVPPAASTASPSSPPGTTAPPRPFGD
jgi:hypothetical protein